MHWNENTLSVAPGVCLLPVVHGSAEYAVIVRHLFLEQPPGLVMLELPEVAADEFRLAIAHADHIPVLALQQHASDRPEYLILEPLEPLIEAARSAFEMEINFHCVDDYGSLSGDWVHDFLPDTYALWHMSANDYYAAVLKQFHSSTGETHDADGVARSAQSAQADEIKRTFIQSIESEAITDDQTRRVKTIDQRRELFMSDRIRNLLRIYGQQYDEHRPALIVCGMRHASNLKQLIVLSEDEFQSRKAAAGVETDPLFDAEAEPLEIVLNRNKAERGSHDLRVHTFTLSRESTEVLLQPARYNMAWLRARTHLEGVRFFHRVRLQRQAYRETVQTYEKESGELIPPQREKLYFQFIRNWSVLEHRLLPDMYRLVLGARAFGGDNFAHTMFQVLSQLPSAAESPYPERKIQLDDIYRDSRMVRFRLKMRKRPHDTPEFLKKRARRTEKRPGEWRETWHHGGICSYPPEDLVLEDFGHYLQKKAVSLLQSNDSKTVPFSASLLDGIDYRETIRNIHLGQIYVRDARARGVDAGSVVIIFSEDIDAHPWQEVWWGEHSEESDMAFYSTAPFEQMAGPGISRCHYGGLMMTYPPGRMHDIWRDPSFRSFDRPVDRLLAAAIYFNEKRAVVHVAHRPPTRRMHMIAGRFNQKIVHIPAMTIDPVKLGRIRRFHVLDSRERRADADDYIW